MRENFHAIGDALRARVSVMLMPLRTSRRKRQEARALTMLRESVWTHTSAQLVDARPAVVWNRRVRLGLGRTASDSYTSLRNLVSCDLHGFDLMPTSVAAQLADRSRTAASSFAVQATLPELVYPRIHSGSRSGLPLHYRKRGPVGVA